MKLSLTNLVGMLIIAALLGSLVVLWQRPSEVLGQAMATGYTFSTTSPVVGSAFPSSYLLKGATSTFTSGTLGVVTIAKTDTGSFCLHDATTTDVNKRTGNLATSTIQLACFPGSPTAGSYPLGINFSKALLITTSGTMASTTITWD